MPEPAHQDIIDALGVTPEALRDALAAAGDDLAERLGVGGAWSLADIIRHVRASDAIVATRVWHVLVRDDGPLTAFDDAAWRQLYEAAAISLADQISELALRRAELVAVLRTLDDGQWSRAGEHEIHGRVSIEQLCASIVEHEFEHRAQIDALVSERGRTLPTGAA